MRKIDSSKKGAEFHIRLWVGMLEAIDDEIKARRNDPVAPKRRQDVVRIAVYAWLSGRKRIR